MKAYGGVDVQIHIFLTSALVGGDWTTSRPGHFTPGERVPGTNQLGGWVGPRAGLDDVEKRKFLTLPGLEIRPLGRTFGSQSLYRLRYPGSFPPTTVFLNTSKSIFRHECVCASGPELCDWLLSNSVLRTEFFYVENVNLRGYEWNETVSNRIRYVSNRICNVSNKMCNTCATSYVTADNSRPMTCLILKVICKWKNKNWSTKNDVYFIPKIIVETITQNM
jgi:hypothetical protein